MRATSRHLEDVPFEACATDRRCFSFDGDAPASPSSPGQGRPSSPSPSRSNARTSTREACASRGAHEARAARIRTRRAARCASFTRFSTRPGTLRPFRTRAPTPPRKAHVRHQGRSLRAAGQLRPAGRHLGHRRVQARGAPRLLLLRRRHDGVAPPHAQPGRAASPFATVSLAKATAWSWLGARRQALWSAASPAHPVYAGAETFDMELLAKSEAPRRRPASPPTRSTYGR